jgi:hypothetical protein
MPVVLAEGYCLSCLATKKVVSEVLNKDGDLKTIRFECGHSNTVAVVLTISRFSTSELKAKLRYMKRIISLPYTSKKCLDSSTSFIVDLEAELKKRGL